MTTYSGVPYDQPKSIEEWLEKEKWMEMHSGFAGLPYPLMATP